MWYNLNMKNKIKNLISKILVLTLTAITLLSCGKKESVNHFSYWTDGSIVAMKIKTFVDNAVDKNSKDYIPVEDRIAVFDMDGTIFCETDPTYHEYMMLFEQVFKTYDKNNEEDLKFVEEINKVMETGLVSDQLELKLSQIGYKYYKGKTIEEYLDIAKAYLEKDAKGYKNLKIKDALYKPMLQVIDYLNLNGFTVYVISGTERNFVRTVVCDAAHVDKEHVIGMDLELKSSNQGKQISAIHQYDRNEDIIIDGPARDINIRTTKVLSMVKEISKIPVLAFGNSTGDFSMMEYTLKNDKYKSLGFMVLCDDVVRENGNIEKANMIKETSDKNGYKTISMKNDFKTIYGYDVVKK